MPRLTPPFRADQVGSFLRTAAIKEARARHEAGELDAAELRRIEDHEIAELIRQQENAGLQLATDGEFRRSWWHFDFIGLLEGVEIVEIDHGIQFQGVQTKPRSPAVVGKIGFPPNHPFLDHFAFLAAHTSVTPKMTIPSPTVLHWRAEASGIDPAFYADRDAILDDLAATYRAAVQAFYDAGCRYLQFDDTTWAYLCSQAEIEKAAARGVDVDGLAEKYVKLINDSIRDKPADMVITTHVCRGNFKSTWISSGGYEPVAEPLLAGCNYDGYFLEYDTERAGGFEPLRFLPKGDKIVVLGLITSKSGDLEDPADVKKRISEASEFVALDQLALSPQCGFASTEEGNVLTEEQQWAKMREIVELADEVWG
ncbi:5-methyltetrahydropteroyltriglutamate--homocysteine S-methyltransferase [Pseudolysinimonas yzui]|uniref:5-methyltetrahydropteroyltriglutamate--homocysteine S-methyltransferase n=1 Tax=Pseudolysinimonas yzui TaxID=2708254 RepID=A0A8J3GPB7_9MICO|nr:5-methyltetrahydropteroyltriglutamate--homocysteine S-methyltransferase [Pseudolysinimonas yzui]GHF10695.1 5-methyltetrahydropteroyltriglutamate--homocysteine S-methyltransferase [Pseudolysinimonas yzui]